MPALYGCQVQYEPLQASTPSLEAKMLDGAMATYWQANIEPAIQDQCIACHNAAGENDSNLSFISSLWIMIKAILWPCFCNTSSTP